jgi:hypothetical protein
LVLTLKKMVARSAFLNPRTRLLVNKGYDYV